MRRVPAGQFTSPFLLRTAAHQFPALHFTSGLTIKSCDPTRIEPLKTLSTLVALDFCNCISLVQDEVIKYGSSYRLLTQVKPGMTGLWQISGRNDTTYEERVSLDEYYVRHWSVWMDVYILIRTLWTVLLHRGAY